MLLSFLSLIPPPPPPQASNGPIKSDPQSLHRPYDAAGAGAGGSGWNEYQQALIAVGEILAPYDT